VSSIVRSDHKAVVAFATVTQCTQLKSTFQRAFRRKSPAQHALFLQHAGGMIFVNPQPSASSDQSINTQAKFDYFYSTVLGLLNQFYPEQTVTMTTRDPEYITPDIKTKLRRENKLMRVGRVEEAGALAVRIGKDLTGQARISQSNIGAEANINDVCRSEEVGRPTT